jgi:hypothetical protein
MRILLIVIFITCLSAILSAAYVHGQTTGVERDVLTVWEQYARCEETMKYRSCFGVLSDAARRGWLQQHRVTNSDEYEQQKLRNDYADLTLTLLQANRSGATVMLRVLASGLNEGRSFRTYHEYVMAREQGRWKLDHVQVQGKTRLP